MTASRATIAVTFPRASKQEICYTNSNGEARMGLWAIIWIVAVALAVWVAIGYIWRGIISVSRPQLHSGVLDRRYGWICPRCGAASTYNCDNGNCRGPLLWVSQGAGIRCGRCGREHVDSQWFFRRLPGPKLRRCRQCRWTGIVHKWVLS